MNEFKSFSKIVKLSDVVYFIKERHDFVALDENKNPIFEHTEPYPVMVFVGTVKAHGTNGAIVTDNEGNIVGVQSRTRMITVDDDNAGFADFVSKLNVQLPANKIIYGEFCGGKIQKGVALNELSKRFLVFSVFDKNKDAFVEFDFSANEYAENMIFDIKQFGTYSIVVDFNNPQHVVEEIEQYVNEVENECPIGKYFGVSGTGEGIVWTSSSDSSIKFKTKGEKHQIVRSKKTVVVDVQKLASVDEFVSATVTPARLQQGLDYLLEHNIAVSRKSTGAYLKWLVNDILSEETLMLKKSGLEKSDVTKRINEVAKKFFFNQCDKLS